MNPRKSSGITSRLNFAILFLNTRRSRACKGAHTHVKPKSSRLSLSNASLLNCDANVDLRPLQQSLLQHANIWEDYNPRVFGRSATVDDWDRMYAGIAIAAARNCIHVFEA